MPPEYLRPVRRFIRGVSSVNTNLSWQAFDYKTNPQNRDGNKKSKTAEAPKHELVPATIKIQEARNDASKMPMIKIAKTILDNVQSIDQSYAGVFGASAWKDVLKNYRSKDNGQIRSGPLHDRISNVHAILSYINYIASNHPVLRQKNSLTFPFTVWARCARSYLNNEGAEKDARFHEETNFLLRTYLDVLPEAPTVDEQRQALPTLVWNAVNQI